MSPARNGSTALQRLERGNAIVTRNGRFLPGTATVIWLDELSEPFGVIVD